MPGSPRSRPHRTTRTAIPSWGYGQRVDSIEAWYERYEGLTRVLLENPDMFGYCYTQLTDTFQEENGLYDFDRAPKFDIERIRAVQVSESAYEKRGAGSTTH